VKKRWRVAGVGPLLRRDLRSDVLLGELEDRARRRLLHGLRGRHRPSHVLLRDAELPRLVEVVAEARLAVRGDGSADRDQLLDGLAVEALLRRDPGELGEHLARGVAALRDDLPVHEEEWKPVVLSADRLRDHRVPDERCGLVREVEPLHLDAVLLQPLQIGCEPDQSGSTSGPHTPVEQHMGGSNTWTLGMGFLSWISGRTRW
jgi:hypothetical protein